MLAATNPIANGQSAPITAMEALRWHRIRQFEEQHRAAGGSLACAALYDEALGNARQLNDPEALIEVLADVGALVAFQRDDLKPAQATASWGFGPHRAGA
jgi:hypothetical protein